MIKQLQKVSIVSALICMLTLHFGCSSISKPEYEKFKIKKIKRVDSKWQIKGDAIYMNNNSFGGNVRTCDIDVYVDEVLVTHINQTIKVNIEANEQFSIPVTCTIDTKKIREENKGFLKGVMKSLMGEKVNLRYDGNFAVDLMGTTLKIPFEYEEKVGFSGNSD